MVPRDWRDDTTVGSLYAKVKNSGSIPRIHMAPAPTSCISIHVGKTHINKIKLNKIKSTYWEDWYIHVEE